jgi:hypothetical protein
MNKTRIFSSHLAIDDKMGIHAVDADAHSHFVVKLLQHTNIYIYVCVCVCVCVHVHVPQCFTVVFTQCLLQPVFPPVNRFCKWADLSKEPYMFFLSLLFHFSD